MANTKLTQTFASAGTGTKWTLSAWIKRSATGIDQYIMSRYVNSTKYVKILFNDADTLEYSVYNNNAGGYQARYKTSAKYRDISAWYHIVIAQDSSLGTAADRVKFYVNGELITSFGTNTQIGQNVAGDFNNATAHQIGAYNSTNYFQGSMSHFHFCDNQQYAASDFGSVDSTTGEWEINTSPSVSYGTTGFTILKDGNTITDQSANSNNWTLGSGTLTNTEDCPSNVFATLNPLGSGTFTFSNGNNTAIRSTSSSFHTAISNLGASSGKYYAEAKAISIGSVTYGSYIGFINLDVTNKQNTPGVNIGEAQDSAGISSGGGYIYYNGNQFAGPTTATTNGDIVNLAMDLDNGRLYWGINGTYLNSGNPASGSSGTGGMPIANLIAGGTYTFGVSLRNDANYSWNFGNGYFGTTAIASEGSNASGIGIFEHDVPSGYTALSTKGLNL